MSIILFLIIVLISYVVYKLIDLRSRYVITRNEVYYKGWSGGSGYFNDLVQGADTQSFETIESKYGKDKALCQNSSGKN